MGKMFAVIFICRKLFLRIHGKISISNLAFQENIRCTTFFIARFSNLGIKEKNSYPNLRSKIMLGLRAPQQNVKGSGRSCSNSPLHPFWDDPD